MSHLAFTKVERDRRISRDRVVERERRIRELFTWATSQGIRWDAPRTFDKLFAEARGRYLVTATTARDYATIVMRLLGS
ncbi:hypothetical protein MUP07_00825 [Candidatus Bathyarchaeota archaeon]|nr:hypothetical protein [Candidatus Bathyarchaeota archaeon]